MDAEGRVRDGVRSFSGVCVCFRCFSMFGEGNKSSLGPVGKGGYWLKLFIYHVAERMMLDARG